MMQRGLICQMENRPSGEPIYEEIRGTLGARGRNGIENQCPGLLHTLVSVRFLRGIQRLL